MALTTLDHVNIRTSHLADMTAFYRDVLGFQEGDRPPFAFGGAWLYCGGHPVVHLVEVGEQPRTGEPQIEHFAFRAEGLQAFLDALQARGVEHTVRPVPGNGNRQVFLSDPDGNHIEVQFDAREAAG